jgi:CO/xanthine dehydrogenase FAD-binding subunit
MKVATPATLEDALDQLASEPKTRLIAGGTDLMVGINFGRDRPDHLLSIRHIEELKSVGTGDEVRCGAGLTYTRMIDELGAACPALAMASRTVGSPQIRNAGTLGGNLGTCSPAGDTLPVLAALDAAVTVRSLKGARTLPFSEFMIGPKQTALDPGELVTEVTFSDPGPAQIFMKAGTRNAMVIAVASLALVVDRRRRKVRVALGSVGPTILRAREAEELAEGLFEVSGWEVPLRTHAAAVKGFGGLVGRAARPIDDVRGTAAYRRHVIAVMAERALSRAGAIVDAAA